MCHIKIHRIISYISKYSEFNLFTKDSKNVVGHYNPRYRHWVEKQIITTKHLISMHIQIGEFTYETK